MEEIKNTIKTVQTKKILDRKFLNKNKGEEIRKKNDFWVTSQALFLPYRKKKTQAMSQFL